LRRRIITGKDTLTTKFNKKLYFWLITFLITIFSIEIGLQIIDSFVTPDEGYYYYTNVNKEWGKEYYKELWEVWRNNDFKPFIMWQSKEYHGKFINMNSNGMRNTWKSNNSNGKVRETIYMFGGSTMWGEGARDDYTIPSYLSKILHNNNDNFIVYNYGEDAYTFPQEIIRLIILLKDGHRPSYVIFYDGANDVYSAYQSGVPGLISNTNLIKEKLQSSPARLLMKNTIDTFKRRCMMYQSLVKVKNLLYYKKSIRESIIYDDDQHKLLAHKIIEEYVRWQNTLEYLAKMYNFKYICFWQPVIYTEDKVLREDAYGDPMLQNNSLASIHKYTNYYLKEKSIAHFWNISNVLRDRKIAYYIDTCHIIEEGNKDVAWEIYRVLKEYK
jgi:hypothetical protein